MFLCHFVSCESQHSEHTTIPIPQTLPPATPDSYNARLATVTPKSPATINLSFTPVLFTQLICIAGREKNPHLFIHVYIQVNIFTLTFAPEREELGKFKTEEK